MDKEFISKKEKARQEYGMKVRDSSGSRINELIKKE